MKRTGIALLVYTILATSTVMADRVAIPGDYMPPFYPGEKPLEGLVITVDPGHGGSSFSTGYHGSARGVQSRVVEGDLNMRVAGVLYHHLKDAGAEVHMTRLDDRKVTLGPTGRAEELGARTAVAEATRSHLFLSLHHNAAGRATAHGVMMLIWPTDSEGNDQPLERAFADYLREEIHAMVPVNETFSHYINNHPLAAGTDLPSAVVEYGFLTNAEFDAWISSDPTAHKVEAVATYNAVVRMWTDHRDELNELRDRVLRPTTAATSTITPDSVYTLGRPSPAAWGLDRPAQSAAELQFAATAWRNATITDRTTQWLEFRITGDATSGYAANGWAIHPSLANGLLQQVSRVAAREVTNNIQPLPDLPGDVEPFGVVSIPMALTWGQPEEGRGVQTQLLHGEPLFLLRSTDDADYYLHMSIDGYVGWVRSDAIRLVSREEFTRLLTAPAGRIQRNVMDDSFRIPPASRVLVKRANAGEVTVELGSGKEITISASDVLTYGERHPGRFVAELAVEEFLYTPYVFGGRSNLGLDCSGLVGSCWAAAGVQLPRDAHQQALVGQIVATPWYLDAMLPGDVLFFIDRNGRVIHTGLSLGGMDFIHASPPEVHITSLDPTSPYYSATWAEAFIHARRPMP